MNKFLIIVIVTCSTLVYGQGKENVTINSHLLKGNLLFFPSITYELGITRTTSIKAEIGTTLTVFERFNETEIGVFPKYETQLKYYYNLDSRATRGKNISYNSANYIALMGMFQGEKDLFGATDRVNEFLFLSPIYGIQRSYDSGFSFLIEFGIGYDFGFRDFNDDNGRVFPHIGIEVGWITFSK